MDFNNLAGACVCGETHEVVTAHIDTAPGASERMVQRLREQGYTRIWMVCDTNTYAAAGEKIEGLLLDGGIFTGKTLLTHEHVMADEYSVKLTEESLGECDAMLAVGSGTVHDITRYVAYGRGLPFVSFPTAASVDGFVSGVAAMEFGGVKATTTARAPVMLFAEPDILKEAPAALTCAGVGDLLGKYTSLADWHMSALLTGERYCSRISDMLYKAVDIVRNSIPGIAAGDTDAYRKLLDGLILSGIAMQMFGNSRPASSSEHHISHFWEMGMADGVDPNALHGEKVGMNELILLDLYKKTDLDELLRAPLRFRDIEEDIRTSYKNVADSIIRESTPDCTRLLKPELIEKNLEEVKKIYASLPDSAELRELMAGIGCTVEPETLGCDAELMDYCINYACYIRNRLTLMRMRRVLL